MQMLRICCVTLSIKAFSWSHFFQLSQQLVRFEGWWRLFLVHKVMSSKPSITIQKLLGVFSPLNSCICFFNVPLSSWDGQSAIPLNVEQNFSESVNCKIKSARAEWRRLIRETKGKGVGGWSEHHGGLYRSIVGCFSLRGAGLGYGGPGQSWAWGWATWAWGVGKGGLGGWHKMGEGGAMKPPAVHETHSDEPF